MLRQVLLGGDTFAVGIFLFLLFACSATGYGVSVHLQILAIHICMFFGGFFCVCFSFLFLCCLDYLVFLSSLFSSLNHGVYSALILSCSHTTLNQR